MPTIMERFNAHDLVERYKAGESMKAIANDIGISRGSIGRVFKSAGINWRDIGRCKSRFDVFDLHAQHQSGKSIFQISKETGVARTTLYKWFDAAGLPCRGRSEGALKRMAKTTPEYRKRLAEKGARTKTRPS